MNCNTTHYRANSSSVPGDPTNPEVLEVVNQYPNQFDDAVPQFSIGIHPWHIDAQQVEQELLMIESKLQMDSCLAVGECGLDKRKETPMDLQQSVLQRQLHLAQQYQKPVIIHCVAAFQELVAIKNKMQVSVPMIVHGFSKNTQLARQLLDNGFYLSFGKYLLRNPELESVFQSVPEDRFFLETDTIAESIVAVYKRAAQHRNMSVEALQGLINSNFGRVFQADLR